MQALILNTMIPDNLIATAYAVAYAVSTPAFADDESPEITIATIVRREGLPCEPPISAIRDRPHSLPDEPAWILKCKGVVYRVHLLPRTFSPIEILDASELE